MHPPVTFPSSFIHLFLSPTYNLPSFHRSAFLWNSLPFVLHGTLRPFHTSASLSAFGCTAEPFTRCVTHTCNATQTQNKKRTHPFFLMHAFLLATTGDTSFHMNVFVRAHASPAAEAIIALSWVRGHTSRPADVDTTLVCSAFEYDLLFMI